MYTIIDDKTNKLVVLVSKLDDMLNMFEQLEGLFERLRIEKRIEMKAKPDYMFYLSYDYVDHTYVLSNGSCLVRKFNFLTVELIKEFLYMANKPFVNHTFRFYSCNEKEDTLSWSKEYDDMLECVSGMMSGLNDTSERGVTKQLSKDYVLEIYNIKNEISTILDISMEVDDNFGIVDHFATITTRGENTETMKVAVDIKTDLRDAISNLLQKTTSYYL